MDRHIVSSILLGLSAGTLGTLVYVAGRSRLRRYRGRPLTRITLDLALLFASSALVLGVILLANVMLTRVRATYSPQVLVLAMYAPMGFARLIAERRARRERHALHRDLRIQKWPSSDAIESISNAIDF